MRALASLAKPIASFDCSGTAGPPWRSAQTVCDGPCHSQRQFFLFSQLPGAHPQLLHSGAKCRREMLLLFFFFRSVSCRQTSFARLSGNSTGGRLCGVRSSASSFAAASTAAFLFRTQAFLESTLSVPSRPRSIRGLRAEVRHLPDGSNLPYNSRPIRRISSSN